MSHSLVPILIADDDPDDRELIREAFEECGIRSPLRFVNDGEEVMAYLNRQAPFGDNQIYPMPGLILLDLNMPRKDGLETLAEIRGHHALSPIPIVVLTTSSDSDDVTASYQAGGNSFITKPTSFAALLDIVQTLENYWLQTVKLPEKRHIHG